jgi:aryl-alcohol dehydrogenase-like predicted oxidoreductase
MNYRRLGRTGLKVSEIALGSWTTYGGSVDSSDAISIVRRAFELGVNLFDTADVYIRGAAESVLGEALKSLPREQLVIATKCMGRVWDGPLGAGLSRKHIFDAIDQSLKRLGTDYVDLYQVHHFDANTPVDETVEAFDAVVKSGKARYIGVSNYHAYRVARALGRSEALGLARFISVQPRYNLLFRQIERELLPLCEEEGLAVMPYNPLAGGLLTGKHQRSAPPAKDSRFGLGTAGAKMYSERYWQEREFATVDAFAAMATEAGTEPATLAIAWVLAHPAITTPLIGASKPEQLKASIAAVEFKLDPKLKQRLDELSHAYRMGDAAR